jgi:CheY-like chemotaxis protein
VVEAADGEEALRLFGQHGPSIDLVLTDVVLSGRVRGRDIADQIAALRPGLPVLYMSGYTENSIVHHGRLDPGVALLAKPFSRTQLARKVSELLAAAPEADEPAKPFGPRLVDLDRSGGS